MERTNPEENEACELKTKNVVECCNCDEANCKYREGNTPYANCSCGMNWQGWALKNKIHQTCTCGQKLLVL